MSKRPGLMLYFNDTGFLLCLADEQLGAVFRAMLAYAMTGETPDLPAELYPVFMGMKEKIDRDGASYQDKCKNWSEAGKKGAAVTNAKRWGSSKSSNDDICHQMSSESTKSKCKSKCKSNITTKPALTVDEARRKIWGLDTE